MTRWWRRMAIGSHPMMLLHHLGSCASPFQTSILASRTCHQLSASAMNPLQLLLPLLDPLIVAQTLPL